MSRILALAAILLVAGCVVPASDVEPQSGSSGSVPADWWVNAVPSSATHPDHDHAKREHHLGLSTPNFEVVGWDPLVTQTFGTTLTGMGCGGTVTREDGMRLAVVHSISTKVSFVVADVTDPAAPKMLGEFYLPNSVVWDADISADGMHVLIGAYPPIFGGRGVTLPGPGLLDAPAWAASAGGMMQFRNACTGEVKAVGPANYLPGPAFIMVGIQDPTDPVFEAYIPQPVIGPHSVGSQMIDGVVYATSSVTNLVHSGSYYTIFTIEGSALVPYAVIQTPGIVGPTQLNGHTDVYLHKHPLTGATLAHLANWDGYYIYDISLPGAAFEVGRWHDVGNVHTTYPFPMLVDDKQYIVVGQEVGEPAELPSGWVYLLDITDPAQPTELGRWTLPVKPKWDNGGLQFSPHYVAILNQTLFVANYHGGLWAVDISDPAAPAAIGIFVPDRDSPAPYGGAETYGPGIGDVIVDQETGLLTTWDNAGGVYVLRFLEDMPKVHAPRWPGSEPGGA
ncbi:MAG TPA: hypothetical protein VFH78_12975 [Candidatus Thermoplasmatota archaeon]|nr:hypothetical protein [Candidatus Thermoplasmatota archaeon]